MRAVKTIIIVIGGVALVILLVRTVLWAMLPLNAVRIPFGVTPEPTIPPRPGTQGIIITGPPIPKMSFEIDFTKAGVKRLDWNKLVNIDRLADVTVRATITPEGRLIIDREKDVKDRGHPKAGTEIYNALRTWVYTPYKVGEIRFWINVPSLGRKLLIDKDGLDIPDKYLRYSVTDGLLYYIKGINPNEVGIGSVKF